MRKSLGAYLAQDRLHALAGDEILPEHAAGTALFADISGFTPLTEALNLALGSRRGAEALSQQINQIYTALVAEVERWHGSVIGFAGDALTCWFDSRDGLAAPRAAACALALQQAMATANRVALPDGASLTLGLKVALASGPARRFVVGDPQLQQFDVLAGQTLTRVAAVEHRTNSGEVLLDQPTADALSGAATLAGWRDDPEHDARYALLAGLTDVPAPSPWPALPPGTPSVEQLRPWLFPAIYQRYQDSLGDFLTELRPLVGVFIRFVGIDYDRDPVAGAKLNALTRVIQQALARYEGALLQITIGDKGSSFYAAFGAPIAHEDDLQRAVQAALEVQQAALELGTLEPLQIGISQGTLIVGAYGAASRLTYAALGDEINLAARLMMQASPGETLLSGRGQRALVNAFVLEPRPPIRVKGKAEPLPVMAILARRRRRSIRLEEPTYALPMVGRGAEVRRIAQVLDEVAGGAGRVLAIGGEAGLGKSRLVAEAIRLSRQRGLLGYGGACQATGTNTPYLVWEPIWRAFFDIDPEATPRKQARVLEGAVEDLAPERVEVLPLLGPLVGLDLPDNDFTRGLQPKDRQGALHALLRECLVAAAREAQADGGGLLLVLEDLHWIDGASLQLLGDLAEALAELPVLVILAYRPAEHVRQPLTRIEALPFFSAMTLDGLGNTSSEDLIRAKLAQLFPARSGPLPSALVARLTERAQGNPFYLEELLNYLHDRAIDPYDTAALEALELPESLYSLVLSRLDQLSSQQQALLKMASVIGRRFLVAWLDGAFTNMRPSLELQEDLLELARTDLTAADLSEPETAYLFKHIVTQQVAYESLGAGTRAMLHERLAAYLEALAGDGLEPYLELLAYHYDRTANHEKQRHFHWLAGKAAARRFANDSAIAHFSRVLELTPDDGLRDRFDVLLERLHVYDTIGAREQQSEDLERIAALAVQQGAAELHIIVLQEKISFAVQAGKYVDVLAMAREAVDAAKTVGFQISADVYRSWGLSLILTGKIVEGMGIIEEGLQYAQSIQDKRTEARILSILSFVAMQRGKYAESKDLILQSIHISSEVGNRREEALALISVSYLVSMQTGSSIPTQFSEQGLRIARIIGDSYSEGLGLSHLGAVLFYQGYFEDARNMLYQAKSVFQRSKIPLGFTNNAFYTGMFYAHLGLYEEGRKCFEESINISQEIGEIPVKSRALAYFALLHWHTENVEEALAYCNQALETVVPRGMRHEQALAYTVQGHAYLSLLKLDEAEQAYLKALDLRSALQQQHLSNDPRAGLVRVALQRYQQTQDERYKQIACDHGAGILPHIETWNLVATLDPIDICLACHESLSVSGDERAHMVLQIAHTELQRRAGTIEDQATRAHYLARPPHARIIEAHKKASL